MSYPTLTESQAYAARQLDAAKMDVAMLASLKALAAETDTESTHRSIRKKVMLMVGTYGRERDLVNSIARMHGKNQKARTATTLALAEPIIIARAETYAKLVEVMANQSPPEQHEEEQDAEEY